MSFHQVILAGRKADQGKAAVKEVKAEASEKVASNVSVLKARFPVISYDFRRKNETILGGNECFVF